MKTKDVKDIVLSVRVRSTDLVRLLIHAKSQGLHVSAASHLVQAAVELLASQVEVDLTIEEARGLLREAFGEVGMRRNRKAAFEALLRDTSKGLDAGEIEAAVRAALEKK